MSNLLDSVIENTSVENRNGNRVVSQQHDVNAINFVAGLSDPGEMISCGYLPEARRLPGEQDAEYAERIRPLIMALPVEQRERIMSAAINRARLTSHNGRISVAVAGQPAWHGLGVQVEKAMTSAEAIVFGNLNREVLKTQMSFVGTDSKLHPAEDVFALHYADDNEHLFTVGARYQVIQNKDAFNFLDGVLEQYGAKYESVGAIHNGRKIWLLAHLPNQAFAVNGDDVVEPYVLFTNTHGGEAAWCFPTSERVVCANTYRTAMNSRKKGISLRHTGNIVNKITEAQEALGMMVETFAEFKANSETMAKTPVNSRQYFGLVLDDFLAFTDAENALRTGSNLDAVLAMTEAEKKSAEKSLENKLKRQDLLLEQMLDAYESEANGINGMRGTAWAAFNAVTQVTSHGKTDLKQSRNERRRLEKRFESVIDGPNDDLNQLAFNHAMAFTAN